jgi:hypothetical protein
MTPELTRYEVALVIISLDTQTQEYRRLARSRSNAGPHLSHVRANYRKRAHECAALMERYKQTLRDMGVPNA